ncbi:membrane protein insertion efficiency factor YidD [Acetomicrobium sp. S15 = DSM 107314]|jgi:putative membrane protein insertion efficiency factor|uniref:membrane protein insertion efficiency factor YidD n=1 Tax=Acetomicrobium sp. S15 = DSM 107314 TaxID=2529858 RepID=UPI0018E170BD|nr:membrane protein insertion efficiency factor YidD [Acetomicrobium sp. S15 = DSM 107314]
MKFLKLIAIRSVRGYQTFVSPLLGNNCRFYPTCSQYAIEAVEQYGIYGVWLALCRIFRCGPWSRGGYDPVPQRKAKS